MTNSLWKHCREIVVIILLATPCQLAAQSVSEPGAPAPSQQTDAPKPKPRAVRVWTDDNIISLRTPADIHMRQQESASEKTSPTPESEALKNTLSSSAASGQLRTATSGSLVPDKPEAVEELIQKTEQDVRRKQAVLDEASADASRAGSDLERSTLEANVQIARADLDTSKDDLKLLQTRLAQLKSNRAPVSAPPDPPAKTQ